MCQTKCEQLVVDTWKVKAVLSFVEFSGPVMKTTVPGPKSLELLGAMDKIQARSVIQCIS